MIPAFIDYLERAKEAEMETRAAYERYKQFVLDTKGNIIWNAAIEAAAKWLETANRNDTDDATEIRKLKR